MLRLLPALVGLALILCGAAVPAAQALDVSAEQMTEVLFGDTIFEHVSVAGVDVSGLTKEQAKTRLRAEALPQILSYRFWDGEDCYTFDGTCMDYADDLEAAVEAAYQTGRSLLSGVDASALSRAELLALYRDCQSLAPTDISLTLTGQASGLDDFVQSLYRKTYRACTGAKLTAFDPDTEELFTIEPDVLGRKADVDAISTQITENLAAGIPSGDYEISFTEITENAQMQKLREEYALISEFSTKVSSTGNTRKNIERSAALLNGTVLQAGETISFNAIVGDSTTPKNGWLSAPSISGGKIVNDYGGGICQTATTLYGAAVRAGLDIVERDNHTYAPSYVPAGLDSSINYPNQDLKIKNDTDSPICLKITVEDNTLTASFYGYHPSGWDTIVPKSSSSDGLNYIAWAEYYLGGERVGVKNLTSSHYRSKAGISNW